jgi:hypothetical protein
MNTTLNTIRVDRKSRDDNWINSIAQKEARKNAIVFVYNRMSVF